jgi:Ras-related GTP-binding protein A/B
MFFITRLTENTNLAVSIPPYEHIFNAARINISLVRNRFAEMDVSTGKKKADLEASAEDENDLYDS